MLLVTALGSCRVTNPVRRAVGKYPIILNNARVYGYVHTAAETLQQIRFLKNSFEIPPEILPLLAPANETNIHEGSIHRTSDAYIIEISSAKVLRVGKYCVQFNHVCRHFAQFLREATRAKTFWALAQANQDVEKQAFLRGERTFRQLDLSDQYLLQNLTIEFSTRTSLRDDIKAIMAELPNVLFVTHCNAVLPSGDPIPSRGAFIATLTNVLQDLGADFCDPTHLMLNFGQDKAILAEGKSMTHFTEPFESALFSNWYDNYLAAVVPMTIAV